MPLTLPTLDDRDFDQLLQEARRRIPAYTPEWTNYNVESDPGITFVQLFAFLTDTLLYRANRIPDRNRLKFLQLLGIPLQPAAAAEGFITIRNERGPIEALLLNKGVVVSAGSTNFLTRDDVTVLPLEAQAYVKRPIPPTDPRYEEYKGRYEALLAALTIAESEDEADPGALDVELELAFYETTPMTLPTAATPNPVLDLVADTLDQSLYLALLAPKNVNPDDVRQAIANKTLSIGIVPALTDEVPPLQPRRRSAQRLPLPDLIYEIASAEEGATEARYDRLALRQQPDVLHENGIVRVVLPPNVAQLQTWSFAEPMQEGTADFPPRLEDEQISQRLVTWLRLRLPSQSQTQSSVNGRLTWVGINTTSVIQAVPISNELLGTGNGEPDQTATLANTPIIAGSIRLQIEDETGNWQMWRLTDDLLTADLDEPVFTLDPESGQIRFGNGLTGRRPEAGRRIRASYEYGGGPQGNVAIGEIKKSTDTRLQGGFKIENPLPTTGGDAGESTAEGERNIPQHLRHRDRLVTAQDFADIARRTPGVDMGRVEVLPLFYPPAPQTSMAGVVTLLTIPRNDAKRPFWPTPDRLFLQKVCDYLDPRRLVTTEIYVRGPIYMPVHLSVGVQVREGYFRDEVLQAIRDRLEEYLSSLPPGGPDGEGWPLNRRLLPQDLEAVVTRVSGVEFVVGLEMGVGTSLGIEFYDLTDLQLPLLASLSVREGPPESLATLLGQTSAEPPAIRTVPVPVSRSKC